MGLAVTPAVIGIPGGMELLVLLLLVVFLFGASKLPKLARSTGRASGEFKRGRKEMQEELESMSASDDGNRSQDE